MQRSAGYTLIFATLVCLVCAVFVSSSAVSLRTRQEQNMVLDRRQNVLLAAGLAKEGESLNRQQIEERFAPVTAMVIDLSSGEELSDVDAAGFDQRKLARSPATSRPAGPNAAQVQRVPRQALVYKLVDEKGELSQLILPVEGMGLWSTLYGFIALDRDLTTVLGITFYEHKETPGLGGEVDNPKWKALWPGRKIFGEEGEARLEVIKGMAGPPSEDPYRVDGLSGATMTSRGVTNLVHFWLGKNGFGPYLTRLAAQRRSP
jgi:Na+-transporting NADH:ubiquinone oxidoreductase subunit C